MFRHVRVIFLSRDFLLDIMTNRARKLELRLELLKVDFRCGKADSALHVKEIYLSTREKNLKHAPLLPVEGNTLCVISLKRTSGSV